MPKARPIVRLAKNRSIFSKDMDRSIVCGLFGSPCIHRESIKEFFIVRLLCEPGVINEWRHTTATTPLTVSEWARHNGDCCGVMSFSPSQHLSMSFKYYYTTHYHWQLLVKNAPLHQRVTKSRRRLTTLKRVPASLNAVGLCTPCQRLRGLYEAEMRSTFPPIIYQVRLKSTPYENLNIFLSA